VSSVVVVGAGPAGLASALMLRALGLRPQVIEAASASDEVPGSRALFVHHDSLLLLESARRGLGAAIAAYGTRWERRETWYRGRCVYRQDEPGDPPAGTLPPYVSLRQVDTVRFLREACADADIKIFWDTELRGLTSTADGVRLDTATGELGADFVVGADGARSAVRTAIGASLGGPRLDGYHVVVDVLGPTFTERRLHYRCPKLGGRTVLLIPFRGGFQVDVQCADSDDAAALAADVHWLPAVAADLAPGTTLDDVAWTARYRFTRAVADTFTDTHRRVLLVGESAHLFPPFGARGMNSAFADASSAARAIALSGPDGPSAAVGAFAGERRRAAMLNAEAAHAAFDHLHPDRRMRLRQSAAARLSPLLPSARHWLERAAYGPRVRTGGRY